VGGKTDEKPDGTGVIPLLRNKGWEPGHTLIYLKSPDNAGCPLSNNTVGVVTSG
jgi:hypothetical protein